MWVAAQDSFVCFNPKTLNIFLRILETEVELQPQFSQYARK